MKALVMTFRLDERLPHSLSLRGDTAAGYQARSQGPAFCISEQVDTLCDGDVGGRTASGVCLVLVGIVAWPAWEVNSGETGRVRAGDEGGCEINAF